MCRMVRERPFLPEGRFGPYDAWEPQTLWLVVIIVTGFSFAGYVANRLFGDEDHTHIAPAVEQAVAAGIDATGPHPADTVFFQAVHRGRFDAIVCMYHDQGHGPMKLLAFEHGVNVTIGLPVVRTSVDHGTAFDIAWQGVAFTESLQHAIDWARKLAAPAAPGSG